MWRRGAHLIQKKKVNFGYRGGVHTSSNKKILNLGAAAFYHVQRNARKNFEFYKKLWSKL